LCPYKIWRRLMEIRCAARLTNGRVVEDALKCMDCYAALPET